jgi:DNA-directed RNA polymerase sigma subunit (sigma70/sigma32)
MLACLEAMWLAFTTWDPKQSTFGTWSRKAIEGALWREVHFHKRPHRKYYEELILRSSAKHADGLADLLGREPTDEEIADAAGITVAQLREVRRGPNLSLDRRPDEDGSSLGEILKDQNSESWGSDDSEGLSILNGLTETVDSEELWLSALAKATADLDDLSLYLVFARTGLHGWTPENLPEIAAATGIGREIVRRKTHKALETVQAAGKQLPSALQ